MGGMDGGSDALRRYQAVIGRRSGRDDLVLDQRGQRNDVVVDVRAGLVWRFPRYAEDLPLLAETAQRLRAVTALGIPAPRVLGGEPTAALGRAHLVLSYVPGIALDDPAVGGLPAPARQLLGANLADVFRRLRRLPPGLWPGSCPDWGWLWADLGRRAAGVLPELLTPEEWARAEAALARAAATAAAAPQGLVHGDLGGVNVRLDPGTGALTGLIDWDGAVLGDPAVDVAAVAALPQAVRDLAPAAAADTDGAATAERHARAVEAVLASMLAAQPTLRDELDRFADYLATWPLQEAVWAVEHDDAAMLRDGLARYRAAPASSASSASASSAAAPAEAASSSAPSAPSASRTTRSASPGG